jgi:putative peptidoglycan lipid II flippase
MVCFLGIPAAIGLAMLGQPILQVLFMRGAFDQQDVLNASYSLMAYSGGLLFFMLVKVLAPGYYSRQDTKTPVKIGIIAMLSNMGFNFIFAIPYGYVGLAIATALSALLNASLLYRGLYRQGVYRLSSATLLCIAKIVVASLLMGGLIGYLSPSANEWFDLTWSQSVLQLIICIFAAFFGYLILLFGLGIRLAHLKSSFGAVTAD